ncbi:hypothetical protein [Roseospira navarrensis]|uniref:Uncharacterized protein n=1 Tax=Roseospira navarrensis TaxID=140058 RepID=A0A7X1ZFB6_9PROT|nr:hypothetical protein [Roseospira navarrensis]MQX37272.1 hypothetical protein [Roseospira navarrensis]
MPPPQPFGKRRLSADPAVQATTDHARALVARDRAAAGQARTRRWTLLGVVAVAALMTGPLVVEALTGAVGPTMAETELSPPDRRRRADHGRDRAFSRGSGPHRTRRRPARSPVGRAAGPVRGVSARRPIVRPDHVRPDHVRGRSTALAILGGFAVLALAATAWGVADIVAWRAAIQRCEAPIRIDTAAFWFTGFPAIAILPLLGLTRSVQAHRWMLAVAVVVFVGGPQGAQRLVTGPADRAGYEGVDAVGLFPPRAATLTDPGCALPSP